MTDQPGPVVAAACAAAGFRGDALVNIVAIGHRESGWDDNVQGDIGLMGNGWGPSVGVFQIRTLTADSGTGSDRDLQALVPGATPGVSHSGQGNLPRQAAAAWAISGGGADFSAWSTWRGLPSADLQAAQEAVAGAGTVTQAQLANLNIPIPGGGGGLSIPLGGVAGDIAGTLADGINKGLGAVLGYSGTFTDWGAMVVVRLCELVAGSIIFAAGAVLFLDVIYSGRATSAARGAGATASAVRKAASMVRTVAKVAAA